MKIWVTLIIFLTSSSSFALPNCATLMAMTPQHQTVTQSFIGYLEALLEKRIIGDVHLQNFIDGHDPISTDANIPSQLLVHKGEIQKYLSHPSLDREAVLQWARKSLSDEAKSLHLRAKVQLETQNPYQKIEFYPVLPGSFKSLFDTVTLTHPFEMMSTHVTQKQWVDLMGNNPSSFQDGPESTTIVVKGRTISIQADNPVENVSWYDACEFANKMSEAAGLKPVYNLKNLIFGHPEIIAPEGDIYEAEGFRLPTLAEFEYVSAGVDLYSRTSDSLKLVAWTSENTRSPQPVAQLQPLMVNNRPFYDLFGNVSHWLHDTSERGRISGTDPVGVRGRTRIVRGGSWIDSRDTIVFQNSTISPITTLGTLGFRLVRTLK